MLLRFFKETEVTGSKWGCADREIFGTCPAQRSDQKSYSCWGEGQPMKNIGPLVDQCAYHTACWLPQSCMPCTAKAYSNLLLQGSCELHLQVSPTNQTWGQRNKSILFPQKFDGEVSNAASTPKYIRIGLLDSTQSNICNESNESTSVHEKNHCSPARLRHQHLQAGLLADGINTSSWVPSDPHSVDKHRSTTWLKQENWVKFHWCHWSRPNNTACHKPYSKDLQSIQRATRVKK